MVLPLMLIVCSPARSDVKRDSNCAVGQAARVHAIPELTEILDPDRAKPELHELQSARAEIRPSVNVAE